MGYNIEELPDAERPIEKLLEDGVKELSNPELIAVIIRSGLHGKNPKDIGKSIFSEMELSELEKASIDDIKKFRGIGKTKASQIKAALELASRSGEKDKEKIESSSDAKKIFENEMSDLEQEELHAAYIAPNNDLLAIEKIFKGSLKNMAVDKREVIRKGLENNASAVILAHNHPLGDPDPTDRDIDTTKVLKDSLKQFQMELLDHIIVGDRSTTSMREKQLL